MHDCQPDVMSCTPCRHATVSRRARLRTISPVTVVAWQTFERLDVILLLLLAVQVTPWGRHLNFVQQLAFVPVGARLTLVLAALSNML